MSTFAVISPGARMFVWDAGIQNISHEIMNNSSRNVEIYFALSRLIN